MSNVRNMELQPEINETLNHLAVKNTTPEINLT